MLRLLVYLAIVTAALVGGCSSESVTPATTQSTPFDEPTTALKDTLAVGISTLDANGAEVVEFAQGEQIGIDWTLTNLTDSVQRVSYPHGGYPWLCIRRQGERECAWDSQFGRAFIQVVIDNDVQPFATWTSNSTHDQLGNDGQALGPGEYEVKVLIGWDTDGDMIGSVWHSFAIF